MKNIRNFNVADKNVLVRCDFNVPIDEKGNILDDFKIKQTLPTIKYLIDNKPKKFNMKNDNSLKIKKIVLVEPPMRLEQVYGELSEWGSVSPPTGLCYIAALLREKGFAVSIVDGEAMGWGVKETVDAVVQQAPDIVGIACKTLWMVNGHKVASAIKERLPHISIVAGGNHVTALPDRSLKEFPAFDIIVIGEGELTFLDLVNAMNSGKNLDEVNGIAFRKAGGAHITPQRERIKNLDELPFPAYDLLPNIAVHYKPVLNCVEKIPAFSLVCSRGCPGQCTFCDRKVFGNCPTTHSPEYIVKLIKELKEKYGIRYLLFDDDNLLVNKKHLFALLDEMEKEKLYIPFTCQSRVDTIDSERLSRLKKAGCKMILFGVESGSQKILNAMKKYITPEKIYQAITATNKVGIKTMGFFIIGYPGETEETLKETVILIKKCRFTDVGVFLFTPLPGSEIYNNINKYGEYTEDWEAMNSYEALFVPYGLTAAILKKYFDLYSNACYLRIDQIILMYKRFSSIAHIRATLFYLKKIVFGIHN